MGGEVRVALRTDADLVNARAEGRAMAEELGFPRPDPTLIATAISEVARNIVTHVGRGEIILRPLQEADRYGLAVVARDEGPGIRDVEVALRDDYSGMGGLGLGLPGGQHRHRRDEDFARQEAREHAHGELPVEAERLEHRLHRVADAAGEAAHLRCPRL